MRKLFFLFACFLLIPFISTAQDYPDFGIPSAEDLVLKECPFEKDAPAVMLIHEAFSYPGDNTQLITTHHIRIKILNDNGFNAANISIQFYRRDNFESIDNIEAVTINQSADGTLIKQKVEKKSVYSNKISDRLGEISFAFPSVKAGSIIEYQYRSIMGDYTGIDDWYFQDKIPVMISRYHLTMTPVRQLVYKINKKPELEATVLPEPGKVFFEMKNIPALPVEPYMDARNDYIQKINFQLSRYNPMWGLEKANSHFSSWEKLYYRLLYSESFWQQLENKISDAKEFINQVKLLSAPEEKMKLIYGYVRTNMNWNNVYTIVSFSGVNEAWKQHTGTSGDINLILVNLLRKAGLEAYPILVSERFHGKVDTAYPFFDQFNSVFAGLAIGNKEYFLDATDKYTPAHIIPSSVLNTTAFIIKDKSAGLITISNDSLQYKEGVYLDMKVSADGTLNGNALIKSKDYARIEKLKAYEKDKDNFKKSYSDAEDILPVITNFKILNAENDSFPLDQKFDFSYKLSKSDNYAFVPINLFSGFSKNPFLKDNRFSNINFGYNRTINLNATIEIPSDYTVDEIPKPIQMETPAKDIIFSRKTSYNTQNNTIYCTLKFEFTKSYYETDAYPIVKEAYKKLFYLLKEQVVLKRK